VNYKIISSSSYLCCKGNVIDDCNIRSELGETPESKKSGSCRCQPSLLRTPPGVGAPLQAAGHPGQRHPQGKLSRPRGEGKKRRVGKEHYMLAAFITCAVIYL